MRLRPGAEAKSTPPDVACPVCETGRSRWHASIDGYEYFHCGDCGSLHIDSATLDAIDAGSSTRKYDETYWVEELRSARERAGGESLVRAAEAILYARRRVQRFLDVGTGPGYLLDALARQFPGHASVFHGVELFPPEEHSENPHYFIGSPGDLKGRFDAGVCVEVVEHLTPKMLRELARGLARISAPDSLWLFNTGMPDLVLTQDPGYLDPLRRGHIVSYGLPGIEHIFEPLGFRVSPVPGKNYAWLAEFQPTEASPDFEWRIQNPLAENRKLLEESGLMFQAAFESARASLYLEQSMARARWAQATESRLDTARNLYAGLQAEHEGVARWAHSLDGELKQARESYAALQKEHESVARWAHSLNGELEQVREECAALRKEHDAAMQRESALRGELNGVHGELEASRALVAHLQSAYARIQNSRSWKLTKPLRVLARWLRPRKRTPRQ